MAEPAQTGSVDPEALDPEDRKLVTLARSARARTGAAEGAAVRDDMGRTYAAAAVSRGPLQLSALQAATAAAISSGSDTIEAVVVFTDATTLVADDQSLLIELAPAVTLLAGPDGTLTTVRA